jgi:proline dehydrogenase
VLAKRGLLHRSPGNATTSRLGWRYSSTQVRNSNVLLVASGGFLLALGLSPSYAGRVHADSEAQVTSKSTETSLGALIRSYAVYTMCSIPALVDHSPRVLELASLPGLKWVTEAFVRITFFDQFVGGDTAQEAVPLLHTLRAANKGALFAYSVEVDEVQAMQLGEKHKGLSPHKRIVDEMIRCIDVAADFEDNVAGGVTGRRTWVAVKIVSHECSHTLSYDCNLLSLQTALVPDAKVLARLSSYLLATRPIKSPPIPFPGCPYVTDLDILHKPAKGTNPLSAEDIASLRDLHADLVRICKRGQERGVKVVIDAEHRFVAF